VRESVQTTKGAPFDFTAAAELFPCRYGKSKRPVGYKRFDTAAEAIRFAIEELPAPLLNGSFLEVRDRRFDAGGIRALYEHEDYPFREAGEIQAGLPEGEKPREGGGGA